MADVPSQVASGQLGRRFLAGRPADVDVATIAALTGALEQAAAFQRAAAAQCEYIRQIHSIEIDSAGIFVLETPAEAATLESMNARAPLPPREVALSGIQICDAVATACYPPQGRSRPHGSLRPTCIFLVDDRIAVADFGIVPAFLNILKDDPWFASAELELLAAYMARELWQSPEQLSEYSDQFAIGVMLYQLATGRYPFAAERTDAASCKRKIVASRPAPALNVKPDLEPTLASIVDRAIAAEPEDRFPSLRELRAALLTIAGPDPVEEFLADLAQVDPTALPRLNEFVARLDNLLETAAGKRSAARLADRRRWLLEKIGEGERRALLVELEGLRNQPPADLTAWPTALKRIRDLASEPSADADIKSRARAIEDQLAAKLADAYLERATQSLAQGAVEQAESVLRSVEAVPELAALRQSVIEDLRRRIQSERERIAAANQKDKQWCDEIASLIQSRQLKEARKRIAQPPDRTLWLAELKAFEQRLQSQLAQLEETVVQGRRTRDQHRFQRWLKQIDQLLDRKDWDGADARLLKPPRLEHPPADAATAIASQRDRISKGRGAKALAEGQERDQKIVQAWVAKLHELEKTSATVEWAAHLRSPSKVEHPPADIKVPAIIAESTKKLDQALLVRQREGLNALRTPLQQVVAKQSPQTNLELAPPAGEKLVDSLVFSLKPPPGYRGLSLRAEWDHDQHVWRRERRWDAKLAVFPQKSLPTARIAMGVGGVAVGIVVITIVVWLVRILTTPTPETRRREVLAYLKAADGEARSVPIPDAYFCDGSQAANAGCILVAAVNDPPQSDIVKVSITCLDPKHEAHDLPIQPNEQIPKGFGGSNMLVDLRKETRDQVASREESHWANAKDAITQRITGALPGAEVGCDEPPPWDASTSQCRWTTSWPLDKKTQAILLSRKPDSRTWDDAAAGPIVKQLADEVNAKLDELATRRVADLVYQACASAFGILLPEQVTARVETPGEWSRVDGKWRRTATVRIALATTDDAGFSLNSTSLQVAESEGDAMAILDDVGLAAARDRLVLALVALQTARLDAVLDRLRPALPKIAPGPGALNAPQTAIALRLALFGGDDSDAFVEASLLWRALKLEWELEDFDALVTRLVPLVDGRSVRRVEDFLQAEGIQGLRVTMPSPSAPVQANGTLVRLDLTLTAAPSGERECSHYREGEAKLARGEMSYPALEDDLAKELREFRSKAAEVYRGHQWCVAREAAITELMAAFPAPPPAPNPFDFRPTFPSDDRVSIEVRPANETQKPPLTNEAAYEPNEGKFSWKVSPAEFFQLYKDQFQPVNPEEVLADIPWDQVSTGLAEYNWRPGDWTEEIKSGLFTIDVDPVRPTSGVTIIIRYPWEMGTPRVKVSEDLRGSDVPIRLDVAVPMDLQTGSSQERQRPEAIKRIVQALADDLAGRDPPAWSEAAKAYKVAAQAGFLLEKAGITENDPKANQNIQAVFGQTQALAVRDALIALTDRGIQISARPDEIAMVGRSVQVKGRLVYEPRPSLLPADRNRLKPGFFQLPLPVGDFTRVLPEDPNAADAKCEEFVDFVEAVRARVVVLRIAPLRAEFEGKLGGLAYDDSGLAPISESYLATRLQELGLIKRFDRSKGTAPPNATLVEITNRQENSRYTHFLELFWGARTGYALVWQAPIGGSRRPQNCGVLRFPSHSNEVVAKGIVQSAVFQPVEDLLEVAIGLDGTWVEPGLSAVALDHRSLRLRIRGDSSAPQKEVTFQTLRELQKSCRNPQEPSICVEFASPLGSESGDLGKVDKEGAKLFAAFAEPVGAGN